MAKSILELNTKTDTIDKERLNRHDIFDTNIDSDEEDVEDDDYIKPNRTISEYEKIAGRKIFLHDVNSEPIYSEEAVSRNTVNKDYRQALDKLQKDKEKLDKKEAAKAYLNISQGNFVRETRPKSATSIDNVSTPNRNNIVSNVSGRNTSKLDEIYHDTSNKYKHNHNDIDEKQSDIYDDSLTKKTFEKNKDKYKEILSDFNTSTSNIPKKAKEVYTGEENELRVEPKIVKSGIQLTINDVPKRPAVSESKQTVSIPKPYRYNPPPIDLLDESVESNADEIENSKKIAQQIIDMYARFKLDTELVGCSIGPTFTRYELKLNTPGRSISSVSNYDTDLSYELGGKKIRMEVPIPGKNAFGIEVPNQHRIKVYVRSLIENPKFRDAKSPLTCALGQDIAGECVTVQINKLIHTLMAGTSGSGKSVCLNVLLASLLYKASPEDVRLIIIDPKRVEFAGFTNLPHMLVPKPIVDLEKSLQALEWLIKEMERRYQKFEENYVRNIEEFNNCRKVKNNEENKMYYIVLIFDEVADYMSQAKKEIDDKIKRLAAKARAAGIHLILATQRPTTDVITGTIKANMSSRMALTVKTYIDSKTILDDGGAEYLLGYGDMILAPYGGEKTRVQCGYMSNEELYSILDYIRDNNEARFDPAIEEEMFNPDDGNGGGFNPSDPNSMDFDPLLKDCLKFFLQTKRASASSLQAYFNIGFPRASKIVAQMEKAGYIGKDAGGRATLFISEQEYEEKFGEGIND